MNDEKWPLTSRAVTDAEQATEQGKYDLAEDEDPDRGVSLLHALAAESEGRIVEYEPGRFYVSKLET